HLQPPPQVSCGPAAAVHKELGEFNDGAQLPAGLQIEDLGWALRVQERKEPADGLPSGTARSNPVYPGSDEHLISNATLQNRVSQLGTDMVIACASTPPS